MKRCNVPENFKREVHLNRDVEFFLENSNVHTYVYTANG